MNPDALDMKRTLQLCFGLFVALCSVSAQTPVLPPPGLVGWWTGDSNGVDLVNGNNAVLQSGASYSNGVVGGAFAFDGVNDYAEVAHNAVLSFPANGEATVEFWLYRTKATLPQHFVGKRNGCAPGTINYQSAIDNSSPAIPSGVWIHWAQVYSNNTTRIYTNGVLYVSAASGLGAPHSAALEFAHSDNCPDATKFGGLLDEISIYNRALTTGEIAGIVAAGTAGKDKSAFPPVLSILGAATNRIFLNGSITYSARLLNTAGGVSYQWLRNGVALSNETNLTLTLPAQTNAGTLIYTLEARNSFGTNTASSTLIVRTGAGRAVAPVAQWHFDEAPGATTAADSSTNGYLGTLAPMGATFTNDARWGNAIALSNAWVEMGNVLPGTNTDFSIVLWLRTTNTGPAIAVGRHAAGSANGYFVAINAQPGYGAANKASLYTSTPGSTGRDPRSITSINDGQWHQVVAVHRRSASQNQIFVDGAPVESTTASDNVAMNAATFLIGAITASGNPASSFHGVIDEVQFYQRALSDEQIDFLYTHPSAPAVYEQNLPPNTYVWIDPVDGNWSDPQRWAPYGVPGAGDTVLITNTGTYTITSAAAVAPATVMLGSVGGVQTLRLTGGTMTVTNLVLGGSGAFELMGGSLTTVNAFTAAGVVNQNAGTWRLLAPGSIYNYNLTNGELRGRDLTVTLFNWYDGDLNSDGAGDKTLIPPGGVLNFLSNNERYLSYWAGDARGIDNHGTWNWIGSGNLRGDRRATVNNYGTVIVTATNGPNTQFLYGGSGGIAPVWNNFGTFRRHTGGSVFYFNNCYLNNSGLIDVQSGTLSIYNATATNLNSGAIQVGPGAVLINENGSGTTLLADSRLSAADTNAVRMDSGAVYLRTTNVSAPAIWIQGGVWYQQTNIAVAQVNQSAGAFQLTTPGFLHNYNLTNGELRGRDLTVTNFTWLDGNLNNRAPGESGTGDADRTIIPPTGVLNFLGNNERYLSYHAGRGRVLDNHGTWNWIGGGHLRGNGGGVNNYGTVIVTSTAGASHQFNYGGSGGVAPVWNNFGTFRRTAGSTFFYFNNVYLNNSGLIDIQTGDLSLYNATVGNHGTILAANQLQFWGADATNTAVIAVAPAKLLTVENGSTVHLTANSSVSAPTPNGVQLLSGSIHLGTTNFITTSVWIAGGVLYQRTNIVVAAVNQSGGSLQLVVPATLHQYNLTNGELRGRDLTVTNFTWIEGNLNNRAPGESGTGDADRTIIPPTGVLNFLGNNERYLSYHAGRGRVLDNHGTWNWIGGGHLRGNGGGVNNYGTVNFSATTGANHQFNYGGSGGVAPIWNNFGTFRRTAGNTVFYFNNVYLNNTGLLDIRTGSLSIHAATATNNTGTIAMSPNTTLLVENGSEVALNGPSQIISPDFNSVRLIGGTAYAASTNLVTPSVWIQGGNWLQFTNIAVERINQSAGVLTMRVPGAVAFYNLTNGELRGRDLTITNFNWYDGNLNASFPGEGGAPMDRTIIPPDGTANFFGNTARYLSYWFGPGRTFDNYGTFNWLGNAILYGQGGARFNNYGTVNVSGSGVPQFAHGGTGAAAVWNNAGAFNKSGGTNLFYFNGVYLNNISNMVVSAGSLSYNASTVTNKPGSSVELALGSLLLSEAGSETTFEPGALINNSTPNGIRINSGNVYWRSANITVPSIWLAGGTLWQETNSVAELNQSAGVWRPTRALSMPTFNMTNGELRGANVALNNFNWLGGALNSDGPGSNLVTVASTLNIASATAKSMSYWTAPGRSIVSSASGTWGGANITGQGGATIRNTGTLVMTNASGFPWGGTGARAVFDNAGTFIRTGAVGTVTFTTITNSGTFSVEVGTTSLETLVQTAGSTHLGSNFTASGNVRIEAGTLTGRGSIGGWLYNNGTVNPGASPGLITAASLTNTAASTLNIELGGTAAGTNYDQIRLTGAAHLDGTLRVMTANNFAPQLSNRFTILTHASRVGTFANIIPPPGVQLTAIYSATNTVLEVSGLTNAPLEITQFPSNQVVWTPDPVTFTVGASGVTPMTFQWSFNGAAISGATNTTFSIPATATTNSGTYSVLITDGNGATTNAAATLTVFQFNGTIQWTNALGGNWSVPANWSPNRVPGPTNNALITIPGTFTVTIDSAASVSNLVVGDTNTVGTRSLHLPSGQSLALGGSSLFETNAEFYLDGALNMNGGTNDIRGVVTWYRGVLSGAGQTIVASNATLHFVDSQTAKHIVGHVVQNHGQWTTSRDAGIGPGQLPRLSGGAHITNHVSGVINMGANGITYSGAQSPRSYLVNFGTIAAATTTVWSPSTIGVDFINHGLLENYAYVYLFRGTNYGTMWGYNGLTEISIFGDPGAGEYFSFEPGTTFTGVGPNIACGGPVQWKATNTVHPGGLRISSGSGGATYANAEFKVLANYTNTASLSINRGALTIANTNLITDLRSYSDSFVSFWSFGVTNAGTMYVDNFSHVIHGFGNGGTLVVRSNANFGGGTFYGGGRVVIPTTASATFAHGGNFNPTYIDNTRIDNFGSAVVPSGVNLTGNTVFSNHVGASLYFGAGSFGSGPASVVNHGTISGYGGTSLAVTNFGLVEADDSFERNLSVGTYYQLAGETRLRRGQLGGAIHILGGQLNGTNQINGTLFNSAAFNAGTPLGLLRISGDYTNTASGVEQMQIRSNAAVPARDYTQVRVAGTANLAGTLNVSFAPGFFPTVGSSYTAMTWSARSGQFDQILTPDYDFFIEYLPNALVLRASNALPNVSIVAPSNQLVCVPFRLSASATDIDGVVTNLDLLMDGSVIASFPAASGSVRVLFDFPRSVTFSARATDNRGGVKMLSTNTVYVTMPLHVINLGGFFETNTAFKLCMLGEEGSNYVVQAAEMLSYPTVTNWHDIGTMTFSNGIFRFSDTNAPLHPMRYYRTRQQP
jgi:hypothetical protein